MGKIKISHKEFYNKVEKEYHTSKVNIMLSDLELILKAAGKSIEFAMANDYYLNGNLTVDIEETAKAYKRTKNKLNKERKKLRKEAESRVNSFFKANV